MTQKPGYPDFDEYIRQGEPSKREAAYAWSTAIGLQAVDGLKTSEYLNELARRNIEGEITMDEVGELLDSYYESKTVREPDDNSKEEADKASKNIKKILSTVTLDFTTNGLINIHRRIFEGVFKHAGELRKYDITKREWALEGDTVRYLNWEDLRRALDYDIKQENLRNRYLHIHAPKEWSIQTNMANPTSTPTSTLQVPHKYPISSIVTHLNPGSKFYTENVSIIELVWIIGAEELGIKQMMELKGLKDRKSFLESHLEPALREKFIRRKYPDKPHHPRQKYLLTLKGSLLFNELKNLDF